MTDLFENIQRITPPDVVGNKQNYETLNVLSHGILEKVAIGCRSGNFPGLFIEDELAPGYLSKTADFFTTKIDLKKIPEKAVIEKSWRTSLWHSSSTQENIGNYVVSAGPPDARSLGDLPNRIFTYDSKELIKFIYNTGVEERPGKVWFAGWDVDSLWQIESKFWLEPRKIVNSTLQLKRRSKLELKLHRWDILGSYSGDDVVGNLKLERGRLGDITLSLSLHEPIDEQQYMGILKIKMPNPKSNTIKFEGIKGTESNPGLFGDLLNLISYDRWIDNGRNKLTRAQLMQPLFQALAISMGVDL